MAFLKKIIRLKMFHPLVMGEHESKKKKNPLEIKEEVRGTFFSKLKRISKMTLHDNI